MKSETAVAAVALSAIGGVVAIVWLFCRKTDPADKIRLFREADASKTE